MYFILHVNEPSELGFTSRMYIAFSEDSSTLCWMSRYSTCAYETRFANDKMTSIIDLEKWGIVTLGNKFAWQDSINIASANCSERN